MIPLPMAPETCLVEVIRPALGYLPEFTRSQRAEVMLVAIALQESGLRHRWQVVDAKSPGAKGPARGLWQFERGSKASRGGVWGVYLHHSTHELLRLFCRDRDVNFEPFAIWSMLEHDDVLAAGVARLLLLTDPFPLPAVDDSSAAWNLYAERTWRPGKPKAAHWPDNHAAARKAVGV